jgi:hypothetical protein
VPKGPPQKNKGGKPAGGEGGGQKVRKNAPKYKMFFRVFNSPEETFGIGFLSFFLVKGFRDGLFCKRFCDGFEL